MDIVIKLTSTNSIHGNININLIKLAVILLQVFKKLKFRNNKSMKLTNIETAFNY